MMLMGLNWGTRGHRAVQGQGWAQGKGRSSSGSGGEQGQQRGQRGDGEGSINQTELTRGWGDYRVPGKLLTNTAGTKQPSRAEG